LWKKPEVIPETLLVSKTVSGYAHSQHAVWVDGRYKKEAGELFLTLTDPEGNLLQTGGFLAADESGLSMKPRFQVKFRLRLTVGQSSHAN
jgi:hypothetical protein